MSSPAVCPAPSAGRRLLVLALLACAAAGCQGDPAPTLPAVRAPSPDEKVLQALDGYDPEFQVDESGQVTRLRLVWQHVSGPALEEVAKLTGLQGIDLAFSTVTDEGLAQLAGLPRLRSIGLSGTPVTDRGLAHLEKMPSLQWVWLSKQTVSQAAVDRLKEARPDMNIYLQ